MTKIIKYFLLALTYCSFHFTLLAQQTLPVQITSSIDSLENILLLSNEDTNKVEILNTLSRELWQIGDYGRSWKYASEALYLSDKINFRIGQAMAYSNIGIIYWYLGNYSEALNNNMFSLRRSEERRVGKECRL